MINPTANAFSAMTGLSAGDAVQHSLEKMGVSDKAAARAGALYDLSTGNLVGYHQNMMEALTGYEPHERPKLDSPKCPRPHFAPRPRRALRRRLQRIDLANQNGGIMGALGGAAAGFALGGVHGAVCGGALGFFAGRAVKRLKARALERRLQNNPRFRARFEARVGGKYIPDGRIDGKITIVRQGLAPRLPGVDLGFQGPRGCPGGVLSGLYRQQQLIQNLIGKLQDNKAGGAPKAGKQDGIRAQAKPGSEVSKLPNPCTFEDLVAAFLMDVAQDMQNELKEKMAEMQASEKKANKPSVANVAKTVGGIAGAAVGTYFSPGVGTKVGYAAGSAVGEKAGQAVDGKKDSESSRSLMFEKIKDLMQKLQQAIQSLSNIINTMHQGSMNSIRNIRA